MTEIDWKAYYRLKIDMARYFNISIDTVFSELKAERDELIDNGANWLRSPYYVTFMRKLEALDDYITILEREGYL
jgi:hypothetical protein